MYAKCTYIICFHVQHIYYKLSEFLLYNNVTYLKIENCISNKEQKEARL